MIGLSLSFCVRQILEGTIDISTVEKLITGTRCRTRGDFDDVIKQYKRNYWYKYSEDKIDEVIAYLRPKIYQPRLTEKRFPVITNGYWVNSEEDIEWRNEYD